MFYFVFIQLQLHFFTYIQYFFLSQTMLLHSLHIMCFYVLLLLPITQFPKVWKYLQLIISPLHSAMHSSEGIKYKFVNLNIVLFGAKRIHFLWRMPLFNPHRVWRECPPIFKPQDLEFNACKRSSTYLKNQVCAVRDCFLWIQIIFEKVHLQKHKVQGKEKSSCEDTEVRLEKGVYLHWAGNHIHTTAPD